MKLSKDGRAKKLKRSSPKGRRSSSGSEDTIGKELETSCSESDKTKAGDVRSHIKLGNRTIYVFNLCMVDAKMPAPRRVDLSLLASTAKRGGKQGSWRQKPKWVFIPQMSSYLRWCRKQW